MKERNGENASIAVAQYLTFLKSDYLFLMNNSNSAKYFANDLEVQMSISLGGQVEFFNAFISDYLYEYKKVINPVIKINRNWQSSSDLLESFIKQNYIYESEKTIKEIIEMWNIQKNYVFI